MPVPNVNVETVKTTRTHMEFERDDVLKALRSIWPAIPDDAEIFAEVPGGGDWSNTNLDIGCDTNIHVRWTTVEES